MVFSCYQSRNYDDDDDFKDDEQATNVARALPRSLLKPYLVARMEDTMNRPCLLSWIIERSVNLILEHRAEWTASDQRQMFLDMVDAFNVNLIGGCFIHDSFSTLFDSQGLQYWLPLYNAASLTVYPNAEHTLRMFYLFRITHCSAQLQNHDADAVQQHLVIEILAEPPSTPEYARFFVIDAFNLAMSSKSEDILCAFLASETGKLLGLLTDSERIWCATKQSKRDIAIISLKRVLAARDVHNEKLVQLAFLVLQGLVESGQSTHFGRTVIDQLTKCKHVTDVLDLCRDMDLEGCTEIWSRAHAANVDLWDRARGRANADV